jgi:hypothetical protein
MVNVAMVTQLEIVDRDQLLRRVEALHPDAVAEVDRAIAFALRAHGDQKRASGELYITHPSKSPPSSPTCKWTPPPSSRGCSTTSSKTPRYQS